LDQLFNIVEAARGRGLPLRRATFRGAVFEFGATEAETKQAPAEESPGAALLTPREAARKLRCSTKTLDQHVASGALRYVQIGHGTKHVRRMFAPSDLEAFIETQTRKESPSCPSSKTPGRRTGAMTSKPELVAFSAQPRPRPSGKPKR
jgi:excisionase family DNA binding protein